MFNLMRSFVKLVHDFSYAKIEPSSLVKIDDKVTAMIVEKRNYHFWNINNV